MRKEQNDQFTELVQRIMSIFSQDAGNDLAQTAWGVLFLTVPVPASLQDETWGLERLRGWFNERIDGAAPAAGVSCKAFAVRLFADAVSYIAAAEAQLAPISSAS